MNPERHLHFNLSSFPSNRCRNRGVQTIPFFCTRAMFVIPSTLASYRFMVVSFYRLKMITNYRLMVLISYRVIVAYGIRNSWVISPTQVRLLNFERPSDALEYRPPPAPRRPGENTGNSGGGGSGGGGSGGGSGGGGSRKQPLSPERVKEVLRLRVDFQRDAIDALDL